MPTLRTVTVKSSGGDYSSLSAAEAGEQADLVSLDRQTDIECYSFEDTTAVTFSGWTTDATRYIRAFTPSAERHDGKWNTGKYRLVVADVALIVPSEEYIRLEGLQFHLTSNDSNGDTPISITGIAAGGSDIRIDSCICRQVGGATFQEPCIRVNDADATVTINNTICYGGGTAGTGTGCIWVQNGTANINNCTLQGCDFGVRVDGATANITNTYSATSFFNNSGTMNVTTCAHAAAGAVTGSTASIAHDATNFVSVTGGSEDYHLASGASATLKTGGSDLSGTFTTDIDGQTRSDWSIGADEIVAAPGGQPTYKRFGGIVFAARGSEGVW